MKPPKTAILEVDGNVYRLRPVEQTSTEDLESLDHGRREKPQKWRTAERKAGFYIDPDCFNLGRWTRRKLKDKLYVQTYAARKFFPVTYDLETGEIIDLEKKIAALEGWGYKIDKKTQDGNGNIAYFIKEFPTMDDEKQDDQGFALKLDNSRFTVYDVTSQEIMLAEFANDRLHKFCVCLADAMISEYDKKTPAWVWPVVILLFGITITCVVQICTNGSLF
jgi:hypothetical protein